jgi:hypothetical protein
VIQPEQQQYFPPDTKAIIFLKNRMRDKCRDVQDHNVNQKTKSGAAAFSNFKKDRTCSEPWDLVNKTRGFPP